MRQIGELKVNNSTWPLFIAEWGTTEHQAK